ncbi:tryptophan-rich sensory protein [Enterococcus hirae]|nr:tryptophan-rich sensory protein [Enterococcus hirae]
MNRLKDYRLWICIIGVVSLGFLSGLLSGNPGSYYYSLQLPAFAPPSWIFGPMWTFLYILMGIALYLILDMSKKKIRIKLLWLFAIQFTCNFIWSILFFYLQNSFIAAMDITILVIVLAVLLYHLWLHNRLAMWLMIPYYLWVLFATLLNYSIYFLN